MKHLAITISGAVSLGAYEAGVLYEVLRALKAHNLHPETKADDKVMIDVVTGASAGGMSATILAQKLLLSADALEGFDSNILFDAWVRRVDLSGLVSLGDEEPAKQSLLSSDLVEGISKHALTDRYKPGRPVPKPLPHAAVGERLALGLALSNLNGIDYSIPTESKQPFIYTRFQDELSKVFEASDPALDSMPTWEPLRNAAVACGAFPFAFRVKQLDRDREDYSGALNLPLSPAFAYTDGGVFHNEPLGLAKNMVDLVDEQHLTHGERYYLFIAPSMRSSASDGKFVAAEATFMPTGSHLVKAIFNQARFKDWVHVEKVNGRLAAFEKQVAKLRADLLAGKLPVEALDKTTAALLQGIYPELGIRQGVIARLSKQYAVDLQEVPDPRMRDVWLNSVAVIEKMTGVENHDPMTVYTITATDQELAGSCLCAFGGFFDEKYRRHDYELGRQRAQEFLAQLNTGLGPIRYASDEPAPAVDPFLCNVQPNDLDDDKRRALRDQIISRIDQMLSDYGMVAIERKPLDWFLLKPKLDKWLQL